MSDILGRRTLGIGLVIAVVLIGLSAGVGSAVAHTGDDGGHHHDGWMGTHGGGFGGLWMGLWTVALFVAVLAGGYVLVARNERSPESADDALAVLRRRYAAGEIDDEEFESRRQQLTGTRDR